MKLKALQVKLSGTYKKNDKGDIEDYENLVGVIPFCDEGRAHQACKNRYARMWLSQKGVHARRMREVYLDGIKEVEQEFSFIGKSLKDMSIEELQDFAVYYDVKIPEYKQTSVRGMRLKAIAKYLSEFKGMPKDKVDKVMDLHFDELPACVIEAKEEIKGAPEKEKTVAEELAEYGVEINEEDSYEEKYTLEDLKNIAKAKGMNFHPNIGYDKLYKKIFS